MTVSKLLVFWLLLFSKVTSALQSRRRRLVGVADLQNVNTWFLSGWCSINALNASLK